MTIEEKLKSYILSTYGSVLAFVQEHGLTYSNVDTILRRGIKNATWTNVRTVCQALHISADALAQGNIVPLAEMDTDAPRNMRDILSPNIMLDGQPLTEQEYETLRTALQVAVAIIRDKRK